MPHQARSFDALPSLRQAPSLLAEVADAPCAFAPVAAEAPLALYGARNMGLLARDVLKSEGRDAVMAIDRNARDIPAGPDWAGVPLLQPEAVPSEAKRGLRVAVSVVTAPYVPIERSLLEAGFEDVVPFYDLAEGFRACHPLSNGWFAAPLTQGEQEQTASVLARWSDDVSRAHHLQFLAWRRLREEWTFAAAPPLPNDGRFFIPELTAALRGDEFFVDAGAHHGSVTEAFVRETKGSFRRIAAIEPDPANRARLMQTLRTALPGETRVDVYDCALAAGNGEATFHAGLGYASQLSGTGNMRLHTRALDTLGIPATFIKLHLEGGELPALEGARQTLLNNRPLLAVTVYHNADGLWKTADWLMRTLDRYRFLFRLHSWCGTGAVIYSIPDERSGR